MLEGIVLLAFIAALAGCVFTGASVLWALAGGYLIFCAYGLMYIPEANEVQLTVRYNRSVYEYNNIPEDTPFSFYLSVGASGEKLPLTVGASESKLMYEYRRLVLDGIELSDDTVLYCWMELTPGTYSNTAIKYAEQPFAVDMVRKPQS